MPAAVLETLGRFRFRTGARELSAPPTQRARALLLYLVRSHGAELPRDRVIETFWPECEPDRGRANLNTALWSIRRLLREGGLDPEEALVAGKTRLRWQLDVELDLATFERLAASGDAADKRAAVACYRGDLLDGDGGDWLAALRERTAATYERVLSEIVARDSDVESARRLVERGTFDEAPHVVLVQAEVAAGRRVAAAAVAERYRSMLAEIGAEPSAAFASVLRAAPAARAPADAAGLIFCGREAEVAALERAFARAAHGIGGVTVLRGDAGSGKSALLRKVARDAAAGLHVVHVDAVADDPRPFGPWGALYERVAGVPFAAFAAGGGDAASLADDLSGALCAPAIVLVDDAQYLHGDARRVLVRLARSAGRHAMHVVAALRSEADRALLDAFAPHASVELGALTSDEIAAALRAMFDDGGDAIARFVYARSGGHAFFAAALFESLAAGGVVRREVRGWRVTGALDDSAPLPRTIRDFIDARLHARGGDPAAVACALALEPSATADDLVAVCGLGESGTLDAIDDLLALGIIEQPSSGPDFRFVHDLLAEGAARSLHSGRRTRLHRAFAARLALDERRAARSRRAHHLRDCKQYLAAADAFAQAAAAALGVNASLDALELASDGLAALAHLRLSRDVHRAATLLEELALRACEETGDLAAARVHADGRVQHARESGDDAALCRALARRAWTLLETAPAIEALGDAEDAHALAVRLDDAELVLYALIHRSLCRQYTGDVEGAIEDGRMLVDLGRRDGNMEQLAPAQERLVAALCLRGRLAEAGEVAAAALETARRAGPRLEAWIRVRRANVLYLCDRNADAEHELARVGEILDQGPPALRYGIIATVVRFIADAQRAVLALVRGDWDEALAVAERMGANRASQGATRRGIAELYAIEALLGRDAPGDAARARAEALALAHDTLPGLTGYSLSRASAVARTAARVGAADAAMRLEAAAARLETLTARTPLDADRAFAALAASADELGLRAFAHRLRARASTLHEQRLAAARPRLAGDESALG